MNQREAAWCLLIEFTQSESLRKHALSVEACMRAYARKAGADEELWGLVGLLHDFDYEKYPSAEEHPYKGCEILKERGYSEEVRRAIMSHAEYSGVARVSPMEKTLFACDELAGFITACALVKPGKSLAEVEAPSVRRKMKDKAFARSVHREDIIEGAADLGVELEAHVAFCIEAMKAIARELGLDGSAAKSA
jgi:putative nucleotidyltransferase with HDIG domain